MRWKPEKDGRKPPYNDKDKILRGRFLCRAGGAKWIGRGHGFGAEEYKVMDVLAGGCCAAWLSMIRHLEGWLFPFYHNFFNSLRPETNSNDIKYRRFLMLRFLEMAVNLL